MSANSIQKNFIYNLSNTVLKIVFPLLVFPHVSRILLTDGIGKVNYAAAVVNYFIIIATLGIPIYGLREMAKTKNNKKEELTVFSQVFSVNMLLVVVSYLLLFGLIQFGFIQDELKLIMINSLLIIFTLFEAEWYFQGIENYKFITVRNLVVKSVSLALIFLFVKTKADYHLYALILVLGLGGNSIFNAIFLLKRFGKEIRVYFSRLAIKRALRKHLNPIVTSSLLAIMGSIYLNLDTVMIGHFSTKTEVGIYTAAMRIVRLIITIILALNTVMIPKATQFFKSGESGHQRNIIALTLRFVFFISLPAILLLYFYATDIIQLYAGDDFVLSAPLLKVLVFLIIAVSISNLCGMQILFPTNQEKKFLIAVTFGAGLNFGLNYFLIPTYAAFGASIASMFTELLIALVLLYFSRNYFSWKNIWETRNYFIASIVMFLTFTALDFLLPNEGFLYLLIELVLSGILYLATLFLLKDEIIIKRLKYAESE